MSDDDPRFPSNVDQRYVTWTQYVEFYNGCNADPTVSTGSEDTSVSPEPISQEELNRRARLEAEMAIQDQVEQTRRKIIHHLRVDNGQDWDESFARMASMEQDFIQGIRNQNVTPPERAIMVAYILQHPLDDADNWASRQGNRWCADLNKAAEKKKRSSNQAKPKSGATRAQTAPAPLKPNVFAAVMIAGFSGLIFLGLVVWLLYRHAF